MNRGRPEGPHGHAKALEDDHVDHVGVQPQVHQHARRLGVGEEDPVHRKAGAVAHDNRRLLDLSTVLNGVQDHLYKPRQLCMTSVTDIIVTVTVLKVTNTRSHKP